MQYQQDPSTHLKMTFKGQNGIGQWESHAIHLIGREKLEDKSRLREK